MKKSLFYYDLPKHFIAQTPVEPRDSSKLLVLNLKTKAFYHRHFYDILDYLNPGDMLVLNDTKVLPARLLGKKEENGINIEIFLLKEIEKNRWEVLVKPGKRLKIGHKVIFNEGKLIAVLEDILENGNRIVNFFYHGDFFEIIKEIGQIPLPHYITEKLTNDNRYQTVYSKTLGSVAAPTAGLHFTKNLLNQIKNKGVIISYITLHVGLGTFRPVLTDDVSDHKMHSEFYNLDEKTANQINSVKKQGGKIIAVGTTTCRVLETVANLFGTMKKSSGFTDIFIYPPYKFKIIDGLITNFHLPESSLIMLVSALSDRETILKAYQEAKDNNYRFYSLGDAMLLI